MTKIAHRPERDDKNCDLVSKEIKLSIFYQN